MWKYLNPFTRATGTATQAEYEGMVNHRAFQGYTWTKTNDVTPAGPLRIEPPESRQDLAATRQTKKPRRGKKHGRQAD